MGFQFSGPVLGPTNPTGIVAFLGSLQLQRGRKQVPQRREWSGMPESWAQRLCRGRPKRVDDRQGHVPALKCARLD